MSAKTAQKKHHHDKSAEGSSGKLKKHGKSAPPAAQSMMQTPTTMRKAQTEREIAGGGGGKEHHHRGKGKHREPDSTDRGKESPASSEGSLRTARRKRNHTKIEIKKKKKEKKGFGLFSKDGEHSGNVSREAITQTTQMSSVATNGTELRHPLKMIDTVPNERTKIVMKRFIQATCAKGIEGILQEFNDIKATSYAPEQIKKDAFDQHPDKNRYKDTFCLDATRVILKWPEGNSMDYIHANWVQNLPEMSKDIICTQGPTQKTNEDFWRMIWQEKCICIIMLCEVIEGGKKKCEQYWPKEVKEKMSIAGLEIINKQTENIAPDCIYTHLLVIGHGSDGGKREHFVNHLLWTGWPDKGVPSTSTGILRLIVRTQSLQPVVVHCSAGIGRTGTIVALECALRVLDSGLELSVYNIIKMLRAKRFNSCQTDLQYCYLHRAVMAFIISKNVCQASDIVQFVEDYEKLVKQRGAPANTPTITPPTPARSTTPTAAPDMSPARSENGV